MTVNIGGRDLLTLLNREAAKKPAIAALMVAAQNMSDAEIDALKVPLPWYRKALKIARNRRQFAEASVEINAIAKEVYINDTMGTIRQWTGDPTFIGMSQGGDLEIKMNQFVWFPLDGSGVLIGTSFSKTVDQKLAQTVYVSEGSRSQYNEHERQRRSSTVLPGDNVQQIGGENTTPEQQGLFQIIRH